MCREKRVFYRAISGLHASISLHLAAKYPNKGRAAKYPNKGRGCSLHLAAKYPNKGRAAVYI